MSVTENQQLTGVLPIDIRALSLQKSAWLQALLPIPFFGHGIFIGTLLVQTNPHHRMPRHSFLVAALLAVGIAATYFAWSTSLSITILSTAVDIMNSSITHVGGQAVNSTAAFFFRDTLSKY